ncbi:MAG TPA: GAF domain-containing protein [Bacteroidia bacterium]|nr:GAF domain-containing protein [Bacteroidia bacterium]
MSLEIHLQSTSKTERYKELLPQIKALAEDEENNYAILGNICAALKYSMDFFWVGFYFVNGDELVLGPFQGPVACTRIARGKGVCGTAWEKNKTLVVDDVDQFPGHIACNSQSRSELVMPLRNTEGIVCAVLDVDSERLTNFDETDVEYLSSIADMIKNRI